MQARSPHFLLYSEASAATDGAGPRWKFVLQAIGDDQSFTAADTEQETRPSRLELLAVVRGLEALDQPSRVTLLTRSRYVRRGIRRELNHWRSRRWRWERFGRLVPIRDHDLWRRVDRALEFHRVECRAPQTVAAFGDAGFPAAEAASPRRESSPLAVHRQSRGGRHPRRWAATLSRLRQGVAAAISAILPLAFTRTA